MEGLLAFARDLCEHAGTLETEADHQARLALQACLFPDGVHYQDGAISNPIKSPLFNDFAPLQAYDAMWRPQRDSNPCCQLERLES